MYLTKDKNEVHKYIGYKSKEPLNEQLSICILSVLSKGVSELGIFTEFTHKDLFNQLWEVLSYYKLFGKEEKKQAELVCRIEMYKLEHKEFVKFTHTGKSDHYTIKSTLKGNAHLQFLYDLKTNLFHIGYDSTFIETRLFYLNEESIIEINLGTEKGRINNSFQKEKVFELMHKSQQKVIKKYEQ